MCVGFSVGSLLYNTLFLTTGRYDIHHSFYYIIYSLCITKVFLFANACISIIGVILILRGNVFTFKYSSLARDSHGRLRSINFLDDPGRIAYYHGLWGYIFRHYTTCSDHRSFTNGDAWKDSDVAAEPAILANGDRCTGLRSSSSVAYTIVQWMSCRIEGAVWSNQGTVSNCNGAGIEPNAVGVHVDIFAQPIAELEHEHTVVF